jgi:hypothetical protein
MDGASSIFMKEIIIQQIGSHVFNFFTYNVIFMPSGIRDSTRNAMWVWQAAQPGSPGEPGRCCGAQLPRGHRRPRVWPNQQCITRASREAAGLNAQAGNQGHGSRMSKAMGALRPRDNLPGDASWRRSPSTDSSYPTASVPLQAPASPQGLAPPSHIHNAGIP